MAQNKPEEKVIAKSPVAQREEEILAFWREKKIFERTLEQTRNGKSYVFYDGPPFATGLPHYGHILASAIKDAVPRYQTMNGRYVERRWGWDCHGLPIENIVEKDLKISGRKQIEEFGVKKFNEHARTRVLEFVHDWKKTVERIGRWVDFDGSYKTMDNSYIESVWWGLSQIHKKGLIYEGTKVLPYCPRCETPIANSEIAMDGSYKDITDISIYVKFELKDEPKTYLIAWTTTPWTLPGNVAIAVNKDIDYVKIKYEPDPKSLVTNGVGQGTYILSKDIFWSAINQNIAISEQVRIAFNLPKELLLRDLVDFARDQGGFFAKHSKKVELIKGDKLLGKSYLPVFPYYKERPMPNKENIWKIWHADFVTTEKGTGIAHEAPVFGEEDMTLAQANKIPLIKHVGPSGRFNEEVVDFAGVPVKPKDDHQSGDVHIIKYLAASGALFAKEKIIHSYPHCFRCETPLFYYAIPAWFIKIQDSKADMLSLNGKINWIPEHLKEGRFKKSMEGAPDWNISRNRYWASPLPIWKCDVCEHKEFIGGISDLIQKTKSSNTYTVIRHGEAETNVRGIVSSDPLKYGLTEQGKKQVEAAALSLKKEGQHFDYIIYSPIKRTHETAEIIRAALGMDRKSFISEERLHEVSLGELEGKPIETYRESFKTYDTYEQHYFHGPKGGESQCDVKRRVGTMIGEIDSRYSGKKILLVTHDTPAWLLFAAVSGFSIKETLLLHDGSFFLQNAEFRALSVSNLPRNDNYELDLHRPYIDDITWKCEKCEGGKMKRISEVVDCWFESGSMPYAASAIRTKPRVADFIAEYIAQTRTWFYYTHAVSAMLWKDIAFQNVVTTGTILAEDGQKMSKSKGNFPDPAIIFDKYGVDALRLYLLGGPLLKSEDLNFSEKEVDEIYKKNILRLGNVLSFYLLYADENVSAARSSKNVLDRWISTRLGELQKEVSEGMENYEIDKAVRPFELFIDDLSTWYLRRSRDRFKTEGEDKNDALRTTRFVLLETAKLLAPFAPFLAEDIYEKARGKKESVHLETWPQGESGLSKILKSFKKDTVISDMLDVRKIVSLGLEARSKAGIKVRQPLGALKIKAKLEQEYTSLIKDEVNVKEVFFDSTILGEVELDVVLTNELKEEGTVRDVMRLIQELRKSENLSVKDMAVLTVSIDENGRKLLEKNSEAIKKATQLREIVFGDVPGAISQKIGESLFAFSVKK